MYTQGEYLEKNPTWHIEDSPWKADRIMAIIERNRLDIKTVCEIGCGAGEILHQLHSKMPESVSFAGYEISPQAYQFCGLREKERLAFHLADISEISDSSYDLILAIDVFEHVEDFYGFLRSLREKGTYKIFHIPLDLSAQTVLRVSPIIRARRHVGHIHYFTKETALAALDDCGYNVVDYFYTGGSVELPSRSLMASIAKLPRKLLFKINQDLAVRTVGGYSLMVLAK